VTQTRRRDHKAVRLTHCTLCVAPCRGHRATMEPRSLMMIKKASEPLQPTQSGRTAMAHRAVALVASKGRRTPLPVKGAARTIGKRVPRPLPSMAGPVPPLPTTKAAVTTLSPRRNCPDLRAVTEDLRAVTASWPQRQSFHRKGAILQYLSPRKPRKQANAHLHITFGL
jgi:hypothetical protein